ncbi:MAG TPA: protein-glutamate O-methyltransferase [Elusimicrobiota bacterium]|nr:protein-glutamate O-methyltransferase [Elusimicrobiota bacterium]
MRPQDFEVLSRIVKSQSGIELTPDKAYLLEARLAPVARKWKLESVSQLADQMRARPADMQIRDVAEAMTTNESFFFRDTKPFDLFRDLMLPPLLKSRADRRTLRIWSAASSSGQEAYSLALLLKEKSADLDGWKIEIVGTDLSTEMVERARTGEYSTFEVQRGMPAKLLVKYFKRNGDKWRISDDLRAMTNFRRANLLHDLSALGKFDIVFCRNVLIYFDLETKRKVLSAISQQMPVDGYLVLGASETVLGVSDKFRASAGTPGLYTPAQAGTAAPIGMARAAAG